MSINEILFNMPIAINFLLFVVGVAILIKGSDFFIDSSIFFAKKFHVSEIIIGLTLVSIGTSLPELAANINSALKGRSAIAIGNVTGSNITNIALIIGISCMILNKIKVPKKLFSRDMLFMLGATGVLLLFSYLFDSNGYRINRIEAGIMLGLLFFYLFYLIKFNKEDVSHEMEEHDELKIKKMWIAVILLLTGLVSIFLGSEIMVRNIIAISDKLDISDGVIGATIVALATSFPELSVTIVGILKNKSDISLGNIVGSNIFNILGVLGITGLINRIDIIDIATNQPDIKMLYWTIPATLGVSLMLYLFMAMKMQLGRIKGILFLLSYVAFLVISYSSFLT